MRGLVVDVQISDQSWQSCLESLTDEHSAKHLLVVEVAVYIEPQAQHGVVRDICRRHACVRCASYILAGQNTSQLLPHGARTAKQKHTASVAACRSAAKRFKTATSW